MIILSFPEKVFDDRRLLRMGTEKTLPSWARAPKQSGRIFLEIANSQIGKTRMCIDDKPGYLLGRSRKVRHLVTCTPLCSLSGLIRTVLSSETSFLCRTAKFSATQSLVAVSMLALHMTEKADFTLQIWVLCMVSLSA